MAAFFDLSLTPTSHSIHACPIVIFDSEYVGVTVGISLLSSMQADI
jgi:hypothetical protein